MYVLNNEREPVEEPDVLKWGAWLEEAGDNRVVGRTTVAPGVDVSTVFLGLDHNFAPEGPPLLFETMVFGGSADQSCWRYATWEEAEAGHAAVVKQLSS